MNDRVGLLVSVRSAAEAMLAASVGVDWIDIKEPNNGPLGATDAATMHEVFTAVGERIPLSVALGELVDWPQKRFALPCPTEQPLMVKFGLADCAKSAEWPEMWRSAAAEFPSNVALVGVVYADAQIANSPTAEQVLSAAEELGARAVLVDTYRKDGCGLFDHWTFDDADRLVRAVREAGMMAVLAGGLRGDDIERAIDCSPNLVAVRGAVCDGDRSAAICPQRLAAVLAKVRRAELVEMPQGAQSDRRN